MTKLSDTQAIILANASQSFDGNVLPLPGSLRGGAQTKVVDSLLKRGLIEERTIDSIQPPDVSVNRVWRNDDDGRSILLYITEAGLAAFGCEPEAADIPDADAGPDALEGTNSPGEAAAGATGDATDAPKTKAGRKGVSRKKGDGAAPKAKGKAKATPTPRTGTKQAQLIEMLRAPEGATIPEIVAATDWQPHTVRGAIAGALKKKLGLEVTSEKAEGRGRIYKLRS